jgi:NADPH-dependent curcumin reductase CurA
VDVLNRAILLIRPPVGRATEACFEIRASPLGEPSDGEVVIRNVYLSCDPHLRQDMDDPSGGFPRTISSRVVGIVEHSRHPEFRTGEVVWGIGQWADYSMCAGAALTKVDPALGPISHAISVRGMPGLTGFLAMTEVGRPLAGETVLVSAAAGAVGSIAGQFAKRAGCIVVGVVGSDAKADHVVSRLGFDAAINYRASHSLADAIKRACPAGVDVYFDCVGGEMLEAALANARLGARFVLCGMISTYDGGDATGIRNLMAAVTSAVTMTGFRVSLHKDRLAQYAARAAELIRTGELGYFEDIHEGLPNAPAAFLGMLRGDNLGKRLVRVSVDPYPSDTDHP